MDRLVYGMVMMGMVLGVGCGWAVSPPRCERGMSRVDGQCVPKPTLVFRQCVEAFRTTRVERERGDAVVVGGGVPGAGSARLERERTDKDTRELASLSDADADAIIEECRRQEQAERARLLEEAWAAADEAKADAGAARAEVRRLESSIAAMEAALTDAASRLEEEQALASEREAELAAMRASAEPDHPCELESWAACAEAAAAAHEAGEYAQAHQRYALACGAGEAEACGNWGLMFEHGLGVPTDPQRALALYERACDADDLQACVHLGVATLAVDGRLGRLEETLRDACAKDLARGCTTVAESLPPDDAAGVESLLERACELGDARGCRLLGVHLERAVARADLLASRRAFARACALGDATACDAQAQAEATRRNPSGPYRAVH